MAKKILKTPDLHGEEARRFFEMNSDTNTTTERRHLLQKCVETFRQTK